MSDELKKLTPLKSDDSSFDNVKNSYLTFPWELFNVVLSHKSFMDIGRLNIRSFDEAHHYVKNYGFDLDDDTYKKEAQKIVHEAKQFIQTYLLEDPDNKDPLLVIPPNVMFEDDIRNLIVHASDREPSAEQAWSCAILRVAHTISHVDNDLAKHFFPGVKRQIFERFMNHLRVDRDNKYLLGHGKHAISLELFEMKNEKSRESMIMKLLHKSENVTADIFDRVGVRIVTKSLLDIILVLKYFMENHVISFVNIKPSRTRNTLVNVEKFIEGVDQLKSDKKSNLTEEEIKEYLEECVAADGEYKQEARRRATDYNPHSSTAFTSLQLTGRQLITIKDSFTFNINYRFFFPFEVQILDYQSYIESRTGRASHEEYKKNQRRVVRKRVLNTVLAFYKKNIWNKTD
ncbi:TIGR04552 family protein [bacterium]|nr:TIGR04552 family protein [bacterium]